MLLLYKYGLILVILLNINEIRSRTLLEIEAGDLIANNGTSIRSPLDAVSVAESQVNKAGETRARDSEEENDDDDDDDEVEDDESEDEEESDEPSEKAAELDEDYMKNHDMVDTHMTELYNEVVGGKKKSKGTSKDGGSKYGEEKPDDEKDKVEHETDKDHHGEKSPSKKKKKKGGLKEKILPLLIIPYAIQMVIIPLVVFKLKMLALKAMAIGKLAILILLFNYFKYQHNAKTSHVDDQYIHDNQLMSEHYGYSGAPEVGAWVNGRSMEQFSRRRR